MEEQKYDSQKDTQAHIDRVKQIMDGICKILLDRASTHDQSKLKEPEKQYFDIYTPQLKKLKYGTDEYKESLKNLQVALEHHYEVNRHHPEHFENGINDMTLIDILELFADWKAATERTDDGNIYNSIKVNKKRFELSDQLEKIFENTAKRFGWKK